MQKETTCVENEPVLATLLTSYAWFDHVDGPKFTELQRDQFRSIGHWLFLPGAFSSFHQVKNNEEIRNYVSFVKGCAKDHAQAHEIW